MILVYLDESGIGDARNEKYVVVAGVIVPDTMYLDVVGRISQVRDKHVPEKYRHDFIFHATDLFQGSEKRITKSEWPLAKRHDALEELISIPEQLKIPVAQGWVERQKIRNDRPELNAQDAVVLTQAIASTVCMLSIERFMRLHTAEDALAMLIFENNDQAKKTVKQQHQEMSRPTFIRQIRPDVAHLVGNVLPVQRIIDTAHFAEKHEAPILQLADACAYIIKRRMMGRMDSERFLKHLEHQLITNPKGGWPLGDPVRFRTK
jgi:hypothetical protein